MILGKCENFGVSVTIITLTYQDFTGLEKTIRSVFEQDLSLVESVQYIIADDGSDNFNKEFIDSEINKYLYDNDKVRSINIYSNEINVGTVRSFNRAVSVSDGDIIIPLSSADEFYSSMSLSSIVKAFCKSSAPIITARREISSNGKKLAVRPNKRFVEKIKNQSVPNLLKTLAIRGNFISGACTYYRRAFLEEIGGFDESYVLLEDYPFYLRALNQGHVIGFLDIITMKHQVGGVSSRKQKEMHPALKHDFSESKKWIKENIVLTKNEFRMFDFFQLKNRRQKLHPKTIICNFDCFLIWVATQFYEKIVDRVLD